MFRYQVSDRASRRAFRSLCDRIEATVAELTLKSRFCDLDGAEARVYYAGENKITVFMDTKNDRIFVESDIRLSLGGEYEA